MKSSAGVKRWTELQGGRTDGNQKMRNGARFIEPYQIGLQCAVTVCIVVSSFLTCGVGFGEYLLGSLPNVRYPQGEQRG